MPALTVSPSRNDLALRFPPWADVSNGIQAILHAFVFNEPEQRPETQRLSIREGAFVDHRPVYFLYASQVERKWWQLEEWL